MSTGNPTLDFSIINWGKADPNSAGYIVAQTGTAILYEGVPGAAKSSSVNQMCKRLGREMILLIGSTHAPEDFSGIPFVEQASDFFRMKPPHFLERLTRPGAVLFMDEFNNNGAAIQAASLSMLTEHQVGDVKIHADTLFISACNPVDMAPNATPLSKAMNNRFWHGKWTHDFETWATGLATEDDSWGQSQFPVVSPDWRRLRPKYGAMIISFLRANPALRFSIPKDDEQRAYPTARSWTYLRDALCGAETTEAPSNIQLAICKGLVGETAAGQFMRHMSIADLIDAEAILDGRETYTYNKKRADLAVCLLPSIITAIKRQYTPDRFERAIDVFVNGVGAHQRDLVFSQLKHLAKSKPQHEAMTPRAMTLISDFAKTIPAALRSK